MTTETNHREDPLQNLKRAFAVALASDKMEAGISLDGAIYGLDELIKGLWNCSDTMPPGVCHAMDVPDGTVYAVGARILEMACGGEPPLACDALGDAGHVVSISRNVRWYQETKEVEILQSLWPFIAPTLRAATKALNLSDEELWRAARAFAEFWNADRAFTWELAQRLRTGWRPNSRPESDE